MRFNHAIVLSLVFHSSLLGYITINTTPALPINDSLQIHPIKLSISKEPPAQEKTKIETPQASFQKKLMKKKIPLVREEKKIITKPHKVEVVKKNPTLSHLNQSNTVNVATLVSAPKPHYPFRARKAGFEGAVLLQVLIGTSGLVDDVKILESSGRADCDQAASDTVKNEWRFTPATIRNIPVHSNQRIIVEFRLN